MKNAHYCRNHWDKHTEHCLLVEKGLTWRVVGAVVSVIALLTVYFL